MQNTTISIIPPDPMKDGCKFTGWYKDKKCTLKWNFENDIVLEAIFDSNRNILNETKIYAGWEALD